jgi:dTDP-4-amino-4,6-dideoxygalactose transaminase
MPVHILGHPVDLDPLLAIARKYDLRVIEDATESLGASYKTARVGHLADIACFSFNGNKIITTGGGGMAVTDDELWARRIKHLTTQAKDDPLEYIHNEIGFNYRLTNIQAAMGCAQLERLDDHVGAKRVTAGIYTRALENVPGVWPMREAGWAFSTFWMYTVLVDADAYGIDSRTLLKKLAQAGVQTRPLWQPLHCSKAHLGSPACGGEVAESLNRKALSLPCSVGLSPDLVSWISELIRNHHVDQRGRHNDASETL